jgi:multiple sugar transport system substrate-binding protein
MAGPRRFVALAPLLALILVACAAEPPAATPAAPPAETPAVTPAPGETPAATPAGTPVGEAPDFSGVELTLLMHPTLYAAAGGDEGLVAEFQEMTGARVNVVTADITEYLERAMLEFTTGSGRFDVLNVENSHLSELVRPHLLDLSPYIAQTGPEWDYEDFPSSLREPVTENGRVIGIPYRFASNAMYYRADIFEQAGVQPPTTFDEMFEVAEAIQQETGLTPWVQRGVAEEIVHDWLNFLYGHGGQVLSDDHASCAVNSDEGVAATQLFRDLYERGYLPDDLFSITRDDYIARMQRGDVAAGIYFGPYWGRLVDPDDSQVAEHMAYALQPTAPGVEPGRTRAAGWYLSVAEDSQNPDAAWALVEYITSPENLLRGALDWANAPVRLSTYADAEFVERFPVAEIWSDALAASAVDPAVPAMPQIADILSEELVAAVRGDKAAADAMNSACQRIEGLLD